MAIQIAGNGAITGVSAGGLNDSVITAAELATDAVTSDKIAAAAVTTAKLSGGAVGTGVGFVRDAGTNYIIWQAPNGQKIGQCWGDVVTSATDFVTITFPITFAASPSVVIIDRVKATFSAYSSYIYMLAAAAGTTSCQVQCMYITSTGVGSPAARTGNWQAIGRV